jgi:Fe-S-cluster containining protein
MRKIVSIQASIWYFKFNKMQDTFIKKIIKSIARTRYQIDLGITRKIKAMRGEQLYELAGSCNSCGKCCVTPTIKVFLPFFYLKTARWIIIHWHKTINGFEFIGENRKEKYFIFSCTHWQPDTKLCDAYASRPGLCIVYPRNLVDSTNPVFMEGCGFYAIRKNAGTMEKALDKLELSEEKLDELKRKLHLK